MSKSYLVIVESPGKIKKLKAILGADYEVIASMGHVVDLPRTTFGIDIETMQPDYAILKADVAKLPAYVGVEVPGQGYGVYRIGKVTQPAQPDAARRKQEAEQIARAIGGAETYGYIEALKQKAKAKVTAKGADLGVKAE